MEIGSTWNGWTITDFIGDGSFGKVYKIVREEFGYTYDSALKVIRVPQSHAEVTAIKNEGMSEDSITTYFESMVEDIMAEFALMSKLRGNSNIVSFEDHQVQALEDEFGWELFIRMELLTPLFDYLQEHTLTSQDVIRMGIDMCKALEACQIYNIIHRDIKPENIFLSNQGTFKLGDFGIARQLEKTSSGLSKKGTFSYMAPEVYKGQPYNSSVDIYSLGIVLYKFMNNNRTPFLPPYPETIRYSDKENANARRMNGEPMPAPCNAAKGLAEVILKACAYEPKDRYESPLEMRKALQALANTEDDSRVIYPVGEVSDKIALLNDSVRSEEREDCTISMFDLTPEEKAEIEAEERRRKEATEVARREQERKERERREADRRARLAEEERKRKEAEEAALREAEESARLEEERKRKEAEDAARKEAEERARIVQEERKQKEAEEAAKQEAKERAAKEKEEQKRKKAEEQKALQAKRIEKRSASAEKWKEKSRKPVFWILAAVIVACICIVPVTYGYYHHTVPEITAMEVENAQAALDKEGLNYVEKGSEFSDEVEQGCIISQSIKEGERVKKGTEIEVVVSKGKAIPAPDLRNKKIQTAQRKAEKLGIVIEIVGEEYSDTVAKGNVISQDLEPGTDCEKGAMISVIKSKGIEQVIVPDVNGKTQKKAKKILKKSKLKAKVTTEYSSSVESGTVISQSTTAGKKVDKNSTIVLAISAGPTPTPVVRYYRNGGSSGGSSSGSHRSHGSGGWGEGF